MDYLEITKEEFRDAWKMYKQASEVTKKFAFTRARTLMGLLEKFDIGGFEIEALQREALQKISENQQPKS